MVPFVAIVYQPLIFAWPTNRFHSPINKPETICKCCSFVCDSRGISFQLCGVKQQIVPLFNMGVVAFVDKQNHFIKRSLIALALVFQSVEPGRSKGKDKPNAEE